MDWIQVLVANNKSFEERKLNRNRGIAEKLRIAEETVKAHMKHIMEKLGASDRTQALAIAASMNLQVIEKNWSGREDLNLRPPGPEPGALPG